MTNGAVGMTAGRRTGLGAPTWAVLLALGVASLLAFRFLDAPGVTFFHGLGISNKNPWLLSFGELGKPWTPLWLFLVWAWAANRPRMVLAALAAMGLVALTVTPIKLLVMRIRPDDLMEALAGGTMPQGLFASYSFPSGDATLAFAAATVAAAYLRPGRRWLPYLLGATVALMRLILLRHHVSDVLAGAALGLLCGQGGLWIRERWLTWALPRASRAICGAAALLLPLTDLFTDTAILDTFLPGLGPLIPVVLITTMGPVWLRWLGRKDRAGQSPRRAGLVIATLAAVAVLPSLGWLTLFDRDEGYYVECAREMLERGDWFVPHFSGEPWMEKPPLAYWLMAASMKLLGTTEFAARLPGALCGIAAVWLVWRLGRRMYGLRAGALAALAAATSVFFMAILRLALVDMALLCATMISMVGLWRLTQGEGLRGPVLFHLGCGLGVLAKGPLGLALPVIALGGYVLWTRRWRTLWDARPFLGAAIVGAVVCLWAVPATLQTRGEFLRELVWVRTIKPMFDPLQGHGGSGLWQRLALVPVYVPILLAGLLPWTAFLWPAVRRAWAERRASSRTAFLFGWALAQLAVFSVISTKLPHYVLPIVPAAAILIGAYLDGAISGGEARSPAPAWDLATGGVLLGGLTLAAPFVTGFPDAWPWFLPPALALILGGGWAAQASRQGRLAHLALRLGAAMALAFALLWPFSLARFEAGKSSWRVAARIHALTGGALRGVCVGAAGYREVSIVFYLRHPVALIAGPREVTEFLGRPEPALLILSEKEVRRIPPERFAAFRVEWRTEAWIAEKNQWTRLYVVSNEAFARRGPAPRAAGMPAGRREQ